MLRWLRLGEAAALTGDERRRMRDTIRRDQLGQLRVSLLLGVIVAPILLVWLVRAFPEAPRWATVWAPVAAGCLLALALAASYTAFAFRHLDVFEMVSGTLPVAALSVTAIETGGFASPILPILFVVWIAGAALAPLSAIAMAIGGAVHMAVLGAIVWIGTDDPGTPVFIYTWLVSAYVMAVIAAVKREQALVRLYMSNYRLDEAKQSLADLNGQLENRVADQVVEILRRERQLATLNVQLQAHVKERSRDLAHALDQVIRKRDDDRLLPGAVIGERVRIVEPLGEGGMGRVYLAVDLLTQERVAVKLLRAEVASDSEVLRRFVAEAAAATAVSHPGIIRTYHVGVAADGRLFQVMEFVDGVTLAARAEAGVVPPGEAARIGAAIADALAAAHRAGVVHRDIKPANLILSDGEPGLRILDFGLSKLLGEDSADATGLTLPQRAMGTPRYMSPEQIQEPSAVSAATDVYSLGLVIHELVAGRSPYVATSPAEFCLAHVHAAPARLDGSAPAALGRLVEVCLDKRAAARPSAELLVTELAAIADELAAPPMVALARHAIGSASVATRRAVTS